jgi:predicted lysophospholipase L1 biosynthesis ABC-type transport system permease subunit
VVGTLAIPADFGTGGLGTGAALTTDAYLAAQCPPALAPAALRQCRQKAGARPPDAVLVHTTPGPAGTAALARYSAQDRGNVVVPTVPTALVSFGESANFPLLVAIVVAVSGIATLIHLLAVSVTRRRQESGLLKTLGFVRAQLAAVVLWQAVTVAVVGVAIGVPLGLAVGRAIWDAFAANLGVVPVTVLPAWLIAALAGGFLVTALVIAALPARAAAKARTSQLLRAE